MELAAQTRIPFPRDLVYTTIRDRLVDLAQYMPNIKKIEMKERQEEGAVVRFVNIWEAATEIPAIAQRYIKPEMLTWTDRALWDRDAYACDWSTEMHAWSEVVECGGRNTYHVISENETELRVRGELTLHLDKAPIPRLFVSTVRPIVERIVVASLRPNVLSVGDAVTKFLSANKGG